MKKLFIILIFGPLLIISCSHRNIILTEDNIPEDIFYLDNQIKPYTGKCEVYYNNTDILKEVMHFKDGILSGWQISYYRNGQIKRTGSYVNGNLNGKWTGYDMQGKKMFEVIYTKDTLDGQYISWYSSGVIKEKGIYKCNKRIGEWLSYDESGMMKSKENL